MAPGSGLTSAYSRPELNPVAPHLRLNEHEIAEYQQFLRNQAPYNPSHPPAPQNNQSNNNNNNNSNGGGLMAPGRPPAPAHVPAPAPVELQFESNFFPSTNLIPYFFLNCIIVPLVEAQIISSSVPLEELST